MDKHIGGHAMAAGLEESGPKQGVKIHDVLADEMVHLGNAVRGDELSDVPPGSVQQVLQAGEVAHGRIDPHIKILPRGPRDLETEIRRVSGDVPFPQAVLEPFLQLVGHFWLQMAGPRPVPQDRLKGGQIEEIMLGLPLHRRGAGQGRDGVDQIRGLVGAVATLATVAVLPLGAAERTLAADETIRQEHLLDRVVELLDSAALDAPRVLQTGVNGLGEDAVFL